MPFGALFFLSGLPVLPGFRGGEAEIGHCRAVGHVPDLRVLPQVAYQNHFVYAGHRFLSFKVECMSLCLFVMQFLSIVKIE
jgi:hypothetical protein